MIRIAKAFWLNVFRVFISLHVLPVRSFWGQFTLKDSSPVDSGSAELSAAKRSFAARRLKWTLVYAVFKEQMDQIPECIWVIPISHSMAIPKKLVTL